MTAIRVGDPLTQGGTVVAGSPNVFINDIPAAFIGCAAVCTLGSTSLVSAGASTVFINDVPAAIIGSLSAFATVIAGSPNVLIE